MTVVAVTTIVVLSPIAGNSFGQSESIDTLLLQLGSTVQTTRMSAFYKLRVIGFADVRVRIGIIDLLAREETVIDASNVVETPGESYGTYFFDVVDSVASLRDTRSVGALVRATTTGASAMNAVALFGTEAIDAVVAMTQTSRDVFRGAAVDTLDLMLDPPYFSSVCDPISKNKIRNALMTASTDSNSIVQEEAVEALTHLSRIDIPGDLNGDLVVNCLDALVVRGSFGKRTGQSGFDVRADVNRDGVVDVRDLAFVSQKLPAGTRCP
jgi:hypothetical protein